MSEPALYSIPVRTITGKEVPVGDYIKGKTALIVNVASQCGFTGQYEGLQKAYDEYKDRGFVVLGFPCNQVSSGIQRSSAVPFHALFFINSVLRFFFFLFSSAARSPVLTRRSRSSPAPSSRRRSRCSPRSMSTATRRLPCTSI